MRTANFLVARNESPDSDTLTELQVKDLYGEKKYYKIQN